MGIIEDKIIGGPTRGVLNGLPVAEKRQSYFLIFEEAGDTSPEIIDNTAYFITYIVDEEGNVEKPTSNTDSYYNLTQNFSKFDSVIVRVDNGTVLNDQLTGDIKVTEVGKQQPLLYTQTGYSQSQYDLNIQFQEKTLPGIYPSTPNMRGDMEKDGPFYHETSSGAGIQPLENYTTIVSSPDATAASLSEVEGAYTIITSGLEDIDSINVRIFIQGDNLSSTPQTVDYYLKVGSTDIYLESFTYPANSGRTGPGTIQTTLNRSQLNNNPAIKFAFTTSNNIKYSSAIFGVKGQNPPPPNPVVNTDPLILTGSGGWLTGSEYMSDNYGKIPAEVPEAIAFGFSPITQPFTLQPGDKVRFEYNAAKDYTIYDIISPDEASDGKLKIKLNTEVPGGTNLDNFVFYRINRSDPSYILLGVKKQPQNDTQNFRGFILPKYPSQALKDNFSKIISNLKEKGIIKE